MDTRDKRMEALVTAAQSMSNVIGHCWVRAPDMSTPSEARINNELAIKAASALARCCQTIDVMDHNAVMQGLATQGNQLLREASDAHHRYFGVVQPAAPLEETDPHAGLFDGLRVALEAEVVVDVPQPTTPPTATELLNWWERHHRNFATGEPRHFTFRDNGMLGEASALALESQEGPAPYRSLQLFIYDMARSVCDQPDMIYSEEMLCGWALDFLDRHNKSFADNRRRGWDFSVNNVGAKQLAVVIVQTGSDPFHQGHQSLRECLEAAMRFCQENR
jgi:hypothetical protein